MSYHTIKDIAKHTGLTVNFIRRCISTMRDIFKPHTSKGFNNTVVFDDNGLVLFDKIKQLKTDRLTLPAIKQRLSPDKPDSQTLSTDCQADNNDKVTILYERLLDEKDKAYQAIIDSMQAKIDSLESQVKLLTHEPVKPDKNTTPHTFLERLKKALNS